MKPVTEFSHRDGDFIFNKSGLKSEVIKVLNEQSIGITQGAASKINRHIREQLLIEGWVLDPVVYEGFNLTINAMKNRIGLTVQTGNIARAFYDLMKFQSMFLQNRIEGGLLILPSIGAAKALGSNVANFNRVKNEIQLFSDIITFPCLIIGLDE
jgi:hypothetical protein